MDTPFEKIIKESKSIFKNEANVNAQIKPCNNNVPNNANIDCNKDSAYNMINVNNRIANSEDVDLEKYLSDFDSDSKIMPKRKSLPMGSMIK